MYDLLILGMLMAHDYSGYKLGHVLGEVLVPRRKLSNGVIYPLLDRLEQEGYITSAECEINGRRTKMMHITEAGRERFYELMAQPVAEDAKRADVYRFKFRGFGQISPDEQKHILDEYCHSIQNDLDHYRHAQTKMVHEAEKYPDQQAHYQWAGNTIVLQIEMCEAQLAWANAQIAAIKAEE